jgi:transposase InsO family protein
VYRGPPSLSAEIRTRKCIQNQIAKDLFDRFSSLTGRQAFLDQTAHRSEKRPAIVLHDRDSKFTAAFADILKAGGVRHNALPQASPNLNGRVERVILTLRSECLDKFIFFGKWHLNYIVSSLADYYNLRRAHSSRDSLPPIRELPEEVASLKLEQIEVKSYVGGLVTSFERKAA